MALTRDQLRHLHEDRVRPVRLPVPSTGTPPRRSVRDWALEPGVVAARWRYGLPLAWVAVLAVAVLLEPAPADPDAGDQIWATALFSLLLASLAAMGTGLGRGRRGGLIAGVGAAGLALTGSVLCPVSAHHVSVGAWWYLQMAGFVALMAATVVALRRSRT